MKTKARLFLIFALLIMAIIPAINYKKHLAPKQEWRQWFDKSALYNLDFILPYVSYLSYKLGISIAPSQVIIGNNDWLFIGDKYSQSISNLRAGVTTESKLLAKRIGLTSQSWHSWYISKNVKQYQVMLIADKQTVYNEYLPQWVRPSRHLMTDDLLSQTGDSSYIDTRHALKSAKPLYEYPLYYKTDSHWNLLGGWVAYEQLTQKFKKINPELNWLNQNDIQIRAGVPRGAGDLASFLWLTDMLGEHELDVKLKQQQKLTIQQYNIQTASQTEYLDKLRYHYTSEPVIIHSANALNNKKVLFLVDSFGEYLSQYITSTFRETLQIHYGHLNAASLAQAVNTFKPDFVIAAVVERDVRTGVFTEFAPVSVMQNNTGKFQEQSKLKLEAQNHLVKSEHNNTFSVSGADPYIYFKLNEIVYTNNIKKLMIDIQCKDGTSNIPIQLFWSTDKNDINELDSLRVILKSNRNIIDLSSLGNTNTNDKINALRLDIDTTAGVCSNFTLNQFELIK